MGSAVLGGKRIEFFRVGSVHRCSSSGQVRGSTAASHLQTDW